MKICFVDIFFLFQFEFELIEKDEYSCGPQVYACAYLNDEFHDNDMIVMGDI